MAEMQFEFSGRNGVIALVAVVAIVVLRIATLGETSDPELMAAIRAELMNDLGGALGQAIEDLEDVRDAAAVETLLEHSDADAITIYSASVSKPVLSFASDAYAIVRVEYALPAASRKTEYWKFRHGTLGGWRYQYESGAVSYYLNFF